MEFREAVKILRKELGMTQTELAAALHLSLSTVNRWETGRIVPHAAPASALKSLAAERGASPQCRRYLREALASVHQDTLNVPNSNLYSVERESICRLVDDSCTAVYVCDLETDELLYMNHRAEEHFGNPFRPGTGQKCYEVAEPTFSGCAECPKRQMSDQNFSDTHIVTNGRRLHVRGRRIVWNGRPAHVQYLTDETTELEGTNGLQTLVDTAKVGLCLGCVYDDARLELSYLNEGYYAMLGAPHAERKAFSSFGAADAILPEDRPAAVKEMCAAAAQRRDFTVMFRITVRPGTTARLCLCGQYLGRETCRTRYLGVITRQGGTTEANAHG